METPNDLSLKQRLKAPTPAFFRKLRNTVVKIGAVAASLLTLAANGNLVLPGATGEILKIVVTGATVAAAVAQATVNTPDDEQSNIQ